MNPSLANLRNQINVFFDDRDTRPALLRLILHIECSLKLAQKHLGGLVCRREQFGEVKKGVSRHQQAISLGLQALTCDPQIKNRIEPELAAVTGMVTAEAKQTTKAPVSLFFFTAPYYQRIKRTLARILALHKVLGVDQTKLYALLQTLLKGTGIVLKEAFYQSEPHLCFPENLDPNPLQRLSKNAAQLMFTQHSARLLGNPKYVESPLAAQEQRAVLFDLCQMRRLWVSAATPISSEQRIAASHAFCMRLSVWEKEAQGKAQDWRIHLLADFLQTGIVQRTLSQKKTGQKGRRDSVEVQYSLMQPKNPRGVLSVFDHLERTIERYDDPCIFPVFFGQDRGKTQDFFLFLRELSQTISKLPFTTKTQSQEKKKRKERINRTHPFRYLKKNCSPNGLHLNSG